MMLRELTPEMMAQANPAVAHLEAGNAFLQEGKPAEARAEYEAALETLAAESHAYVYLTIPRTYYLEENMEQTEATLRKVLELEPDNVDGLKLLSNLLISSGREAEAQEFMARFRRVSDYRPMPISMSASSSNNNGDLDGALTEFEDGRGALPRGSSGLLLVGGWC